jgi:hypothetical protein
MSRDLHELLAPLQADEDALTPLFRTHLDDSMLRQIAEADYGWEAEKCDVLLSAMLASGDTAPDDCNLSEVLELIRWSEPEDLVWAPGGQGTRGHWMRLFACAALLRLAHRHRGTLSGECETLAQFAASAITLGKPVVQAAASMLAWRVLIWPGDGETRAFLAFSILLLAVYLGGPGRWLKSLADWVEEEESEMGEEQSGHEWLLGRTFSRIKEATWQSLARRILAQPAADHPPEADQSLRLLGELVAGI